MIVADSHIIVIFGASGDLTSRKLLPSLYQLFKDRLLPPQFAILGASRTNYSDEEFREKMKENIKDKGNDIDEFLKKVFYLAMDTLSSESYEALKIRLEELGSKLEISPNYLFYLSTPPNLYQVIPAMLAKIGLNSTRDGFRRLIIEKPFGSSLESARKLNNNLLRNFKEDQIFRIDHYLGKETVQNLMVTRFANGIFEPIWNRNFIERVEVTAVETLGIENRGGYYEQSGALRDMVQNHLLQMVALIAMEPPVEIEADPIRYEKMKVFQSIRPINPKDVADQVIRGQYTASKIKGENIAAYREEKNVDNESHTETYVALKFYIDNWRWAGVPFYIRTGKRMPTSVTEVVIEFKPTPHHLFDESAFDHHSSNQLILRIQPDEGVLLKIGMKEPGSGFKVKPVNIDFHYSSLADIKLPSAYERLLLDVMRGDPTLFSRGDTVEAAWEFIQPILDAWQNDPSIPLYGYPAGTWGPIEADQLMEGDQTWRYPCKNLSDDGLYCEL
jgi:glucose-6-phosphate 1-dehydrogenase